jgi:hypothetical protein
MLNTHLTNRMPNLYPEGDVFRPERWFKIAPTAFPAPSISTPSRLSWSGGSGVASPAAGTLRMYAITARVSSSLKLPALV